MTSGAKRAKKAETAQPPQTITAWKGFNADLACTGGGEPFQFKVGETYVHTGTVAACSSGFHACENPFDVWPYYGLGNGNRFCRVQLSGNIDRHEGDSKIAAERLTVETEVTLGEMIRAGVKHEIDAAFAKGSGNSATNASSGDYATNASSGDSARNASSGNYATNASSGNYATNASSGDYATNASSGYSATNASSGNSATNASSGNSARNASSGNYATNEASGANSVIAAAGLNSLAKGALGTAIAQPYKDDKDQIRFACGVIGEDGLKPDTWYRAEAGKLVEAA